MVWQRERCPRTGRPHIQGYVRFKNRKRGSTVQRMLGQEGLHLDKCRGNEQQCKDYCTKIESRMGVGEEHGDFDAEEGKQGARGDLEVVAEAVKAGASMQAVARDYSTSYIRYHRGIEALSNAIRPPPAVQRDVQVTVYCGPTGTGKTHRVLTQYPDCYSVTEGPHPWDQYSSQRVIFLDEFDWKSWPIDTMKKVLDKWRMPLPCRYANKYAEWTHVLICANTSPVCWYEGATITSLLAFRRRIAGRCFWVTDRDTPEAEMQQIPL